MTRFVQWMDDTHTRRYCWHPDVPGDLDGTGSLVRSKLRDGWTFDAPVALRLTEASAQKYAWGNKCMIREEIEEIAA